MNLPKTILGLALLATALSCTAQGTAFTYQGRLNDSTNPANGSYDLTFALNTTPTTASQAGVTLTNLNVGVSNGIFTTMLDFGATPAFAGTIYYLQINVRTNGSTNFTALSPRQQLTPAPYAIYATTAGNFTGTISPAQLGGGTVGSTYKFISSQNTFAGDGSGLTGVNAGSLGGLAAGNFWQTTGNAGTSPTNGNFLGTTDNQPLEIKANSSRVMRYEPNTNGAPNVVGGASVNFVIPGIYGGTIAGGGASSLGKFVYPNSIVGNFGSIGGGYFNTIKTNATAATIGGGGQNTIGTAATSATISGGSFNVIGNSAGSATIGGGQGNLATNWGTTVGGGGFDGTNFASNVAGGVASTVAGGLGNSSLSLHATIGGGSMNSVQPNAENSVISGGTGNFIGTNNSASGVGSGSGNTILGSESLIVGGGCFIGGGFNNDIGANAYDTFIGSGTGNLINSNAAYSVIPGGFENEVDGAWSLAAGQQAQALHNGTFVWADSQDLTFSSTTNDQFLVRAQGGVGINTNNPAGAALSVNGRITSPLWKASTPINTGGSLNRSGVFTSSGGTLILSVSGSGYTTSAGVVIGMDIKLDGTTIDSCTIYANPALTHLAFVPKTIVKTGVAAGSHTLLLSARSGTTTDGSDTFCVTVQELPF